MTSINNVIYKQENDILDGLRNLKETLLLRRKRDLEFSEQDMRNINERRKMMKQYTEFLPNGQVDEVALTENNFYKGKLPDNYFIPIEPRLFDRDVYKTTVIDKIIKPIVTEDGKSMIFNFKIENLIEYNGIILSLKIENQNENNWLQLDGKEYNLIKSIKLLFNNILVESHENWNEVWRTTDLIYSSNYSGTNKDYIDNFSSTILDNGKYLQRNAGGLLLSPEEIGTNLIFNPPNNFKSYLQVGKITNGKIDFTQTNVLNVEIPIKLYKFGNFTTSNDMLKPDNLVDLREYDNITLAIEMNPEAFFVPIFNATIHDLVNVAVDGSWYSENRKLRDQLENLKKLNRELKDPLTNLNKNLKDRTQNKYKLEDKIANVEELRKNEEYKHNSFLKLYRDELIMSYEDITETSRFKQNIIKSKLYNDENDLSDPKILLNIIFGYLNLEDKFTPSEVFDTLNYKGIKVIVVDLIEKSNNFGKSNTNSEYIINNDVDDNNIIYSNVRKNEIHFLINCYRQSKSENSFIDAIEVLLKKQCKVFEIDRMINGNVEYSSMFNINEIKLLKTKGVDITTDFLLDHISNTNKHPFNEILESAKLNTGLTSLNTKVKHIKNLKKNIINDFISFSNKLNDDGEFIEKIKQAFAKSFTSDAIFITKALRSFNYFEKIYCIYEGFKTILIDNENVIEELKKDIDLKDSLIVLELNKDLNTTNQFIPKITDTWHDNINNNIVYFYNSLNNTQIKNPQNLVYSYADSIINNKMNYEYDDDLTIFKVENVISLNQNKPLFKVTIPKLKILNKFRKKNDYLDSLTNTFKLDFIFEIMKDYSIENTVKIINDYYEDTIDKVFIDEAPIIKELLTLYNDYKDDDDNDKIKVIRDLLFNFIDFTSILKNFKLWNLKLLNSTLNKTEFSLANDTYIHSSERYLPFSVNEFDDNKVILPFENVVKTSKTLSQYIIDNNFFDESSRRALEIVNLLNLITEMDKNSGSNSKKYTLYDYNSNLFNNLNIAYDANEIDKIYYNKIDELMDYTSGPTNFLLFGFIDLYIYLSQSSILKSSSNTNNINNIERIYTLIDCVINRVNFENTEHMKDECINILKSSFNTDLVISNNVTSIENYFKDLISGFIDIIFEGKITKKEDSDEMNSEMFGNRFENLIKNLGKYKMFIENKDKGVFSFDFPLIDCSLFTFDANTDITRHKLIKYVVDVSDIIDNSKLNKENILVNYIKKILVRLSTPYDERKKFEEDENIKNTRSYLYSLSVFILILLRNTRIEYNNNLNEYYVNMNDDNKVNKLKLDKKNKIIETRILEETGDDINLYNQTSFLEKIIKTISDDIRLTFNILKKIKNKIDPTCFTILNKIYNSYLYLIKMLITQEDDYSNEGIEKDNDELRKFWKIIYYINHLFFDFKLVIETWENVIQDEIIKYIQQKSVGIEIKDNDNGDDKDKDIEMGIPNTSLNKFIKSKNIDKIFDFEKIKIGFNLKQYKIVKIITEEMLNVKLSSGISIQNEINNFLDPDYIDKLEYKLTTKIKSTLDNPWITQYEYSLINNEKRLSSAPKIDKSYVVTDAILVAKSLPLDSKYDNRIETFSLQNQPKVFLKKVYSEVFDVNKDFSIPIGPNINRLFIYFTDFILEKYPTYRKSTFVSVPLETFAIVHGDKIYPETFFVGKISDSNSNFMFLKELAAALGYGFSKESVELMERETPFNRLNYAINSSTTGFITEKLYLNDIQKKYDNFDFKEMNDMFLFNNDTNKMIDAVFGYDQEIISKFILGFDLNKIRNDFKMLGSKEPLNEFRFTFDYNKLQNFKNRIKINIITDYNIKV